MIVSINELAEAWVNYFLLTLLQNSFFLAGIFLILHLLRKQDARLLRAVALVGLVKLLLPPLLPSGAAEHVPFLLFDTEIVLLSSDSTALTSIPLSSQALLMLLWLGIALGILGVSLYRTCRLRAYFRSAQPLDVHPYLEAKARAMLGRVIFLQSDRHHSPLVFGFFEHRVVLPASWQTWSAECKRAVLAHELAHIRQRDHWVHLLQTLIQAFHFMNPLVWLLNRRLTQYSELACDDAAVSMARLSAIGYTKQLIFVAEIITSSQHVCSAKQAISGSHKLLKRRILYQLTETATTGGVARPRLIVACVALAMLPFSLDHVSPRPATGAAVEVGAAAGYFVPPEPVGGFAMLTEYLQESTRQLRVEGGEDESDIVVQVVLGSDGNILETELKGGTCQASYEQVREVLQSIAWQPARADGKAVQARLDLTFYKRDQQAIQ